LDELPKNIKNVEKVRGSLEEKFAAKEKLEIVQSERVASVGGREGVLGGIPPALQILGEICSNFFERTPPVGKCLCWLVASFEGLLKAGFIHF